MKYLLFFSLLLACLAAHGFYLASVVRRQKRHRDERRKAIEPNTTVKQVVRSGGKERIRIIHCTHAGFGAVLERRHRDDWLIEHIAGPGAVFESAELAEAQAVKIGSWYHSNNA